MKREHCTEIMNAAKKIGYHEAMRRLRRQTDAGDGLDPLRGIRPPETNSSALTGAVNGNSDRHQDRQTP